MEYNLDFFLKQLYFKFFKSIPSKVLLIIGIVVATISIIFKDSYQLIISQLIVYLFFSSLVNCMIYGGCTISAYFLIIIPVLSGFIIILDKIGYFNNLKIKLQKIVNYLKKKETIELDTLGVDNSLGIVYYHGEEN